MSSKCFKKGIEIKQIKLSFSNFTSSFSPVYVYHGQVSKRLTKKITVFLEQWKDAIDEENEDRLDSLYQNNIDNIIAYLNECKLDKFIDLDEWDGEDDLPEDVVIPHPTFVSIAKAIFAAKNGGFRRDAIILLHLYVEAYVIKMVRAADMIAATNKRSRCQGVDLQLAFAIHNL